MRSISTATLLCLLQLGHGIKWLALYKYDDTWSPEFECPLNKTERKAVGMVAHQARMCKRFPELMPLIIRSAQLSVDNCQSVFADSRWNCTSLTLAPDLKADLTKGTKEQAFVYALSAAAITHQIAKACASGFKYCPCGYAETSIASGANSPDAYRWKGCSDNVEYGKRASAEWTDSIYKHSTFKKRKAAEETTTVSNVLEFDEETLNADPEPTSNRAGPKARMNIYNNNVGRIVTQQRLFQKCKCHGLSSSCEIRTCWSTLPPLTSIANALKERYNLAQIEKETEITYETKGESRPTRVTVPLPELIYIKSSPTYCDEDIENGSFGTRSRECNATTSGTGNCENLCCGRGFNTKQYTVEEQCKCKYVHCCYIKCKTCTSIIDKHFCK
ncbi:unnamed protein product [Bursaphelenchus okinawaensis]|uniref:Protein Wnt n=1 Tax=Bursaphelenchus okinawaensis TaxID=465554 RepID=A0A811LML7_9BILA|nr:unnamed protein product [Bursaphelenchus okinawaensis]CAG9126857.1 unnamed protein product [Bursaphelenchus okinawaensis]